MDVDLIFKIAAVGILVAVLNLVLVRSGREEQAMMTTLAGLVVVLMMLVQQISDLFDLVKTLFRSEMETVMKVTALCLVGAVLAALLKKSSPGWRCCWRWRRARRCCWRWCGAWRP